MAEGEAAYQRYLAYDWEADQQWGIHRLNVYVPPGSGAENNALWEKIKRKYYKRHVVSNPVCS